MKFYRETLGFEIATEIAGRAAFLRALAPPTTTTSGFSRSGTPRSRRGAKGEAGYPTARRCPACTTSPGRSGRLPELAEIRGKLAAHGALVGASDHRVSKSLYAKDPDGIEFEVMWRVPAKDWEEEVRKGDMIAPLDLDAALARWGDLVTGAAAGSAT